MIRAGRNHKNGARAASFLFAAALASLVFVLAGSVAKAHAQALSAESIELSECGIFEMQVVGSRPAPGMISKQVTIATTPKLCVSTERVPAALGLKFGCTFVVRGHPRGALVQVRGATIPPARVAPSEAEWQVPAGSPSGWFYSFDRERDLVPGEWVLELYLGERKLAERRFTVVRQTASR